MSALATFDTSGRILQTGTNSSSSLIHPQFTGSISILWASRQSHHFCACKTDRFTCSLSAAAVAGIFSMALPRLANRSRLVYLDTIKCFAIQGNNKLFDNVSVGLTCISRRRCHFLEYRCCTGHLLPGVNKRLLTLSVEWWGGIAATKRVEEEVSGGGLGSEGIGNLVNWYELQMLPDSKLEPQLLEAGYSVESWKSNHCNNITIHGLDQNTGTFFSSISDMHKHTLICLFDVAWHQWLEIDIRLVWNSPVFESPNENSMSAVNVLGQWFDN